MGVYGVTIWEDVHAGTSSFIDFYSTLSLYICLHTVKVKVPESIIFVHLNELLLNFLRAIVHFIPTLFQGFYKPIPKLSIWVI